MVDLLSTCHEEALADAVEVIGTLVDGPLVPENEISVIPTAQIQDTAMIDLINTVQMYYTGAQVSASALFVKDANLLPGDIRKCDLARVYKFSNTLYKLQMTGTQLLTPGEIFREGDLPVLLEMDVHGEIGGVREMIRDYIIQVKGGILSLECDNSWKITGNGWDPALHQKAVEMIAAGELSVPASEDGKHLNAKAITEDDIMK